jgi:hypothetical protein
MKRKLFPFALIISSFFLFACGLTGLLNENQPVNVPEATTLPTQKMEEQTAEDPPAETVEEPEPTSADPQSQNACDHPYFPVEDGVTWTYEFNSGEGYTLTLNEVEEDTFRMTQEMAESETVFTVDWYCTDDGILRGTFAQVDILQESTGEETPEIEFETLSWEGETLPTPDLWEVGYTWSSEYTLSGEVDMQGVTATSEITVTIDHTLAAVDEVTVPAGTFPEAYRVDSAGEIDMVMVMGETSTPVSGITFSYETWYVRDLGMVKTGATYQGYSDSTVLVGSSLLPLE